MPDFLVKDPKGAYERFLALYFYRLYAPGPKFELLFIISSTFFFYCPKYVINFIIMYLFYLYNNYMFANYC